MVGAAVLVRPAAVLGQREADDAPPAVDAAQLGVTGEVAGVGGADFQTRNSPETL